jgi:hypothetical protein
MKLAPAQQPASDGEAQQRRQDIIKGRVLNLLGRPEDLREVQVRPLWDNHYRVNVFVGTSVGLSSIAHSFFVSADGEGNILATTPVIRKLYAPAGGEPKAK